MIEVGEVVRASDGSVDVRIAPSERCEECGCCAAVGADAMVMSDVADTHHARPGDTVEVEVPEGSRLRASLIGYGLPIAILVAGYLAGYLLADVIGADADVTGAVAAILSVAAALVWLRSRGAGLMSAERYRPRVRAIIRRGAAP